MITAELKKDGMEKIREDYDLCMRDAFDKGLTEPARAMALKMAKAYMAAMMTLDKSLHGIGAERGVMFVAEDLPFETKMTPFVSLRAIDLVELGKKVRSLCGNPHDVINLVSYKGETHGFLLGGQGEGNVEVYRKRSVY